MRLGTPFLIASLVVHWLAAPASVLAQRKDPPAGVSAADEKRQADDKMLSLDYQGALELYDLLYARTKDPALHYNRARALAALQRFPEALSMIEAFDRDAPAELKARVPKLDELVSSIRQRVARISVSEKKGVKATVRLDDRVMGVTPLVDLRVNAGRARLRLDADGYESTTLSIDLLGGKSGAFALELAPKDKRATLTVRSSAPGATVTIDDKDYGQVPVTAKVTPGSHRVLVDAPGYDESDSQVDVAMAERREMEVSLSESLGVHERWWFWTLIGGAVAAGAATSIAIAATTEASATSGSIDPGKIPIGPDHRPLALSFTIPF